MENPAQTQGNTAPASAKKDDRKSKNALFIIVIAILTVLSGVLGWQYMEQKKMIETMITERGNLESEKKAVEAELTDMLGQYEGMQTENAELNTRINEQKEKIEELLKQAEKHKDDAYIIYKLKKETESLRVIMKGFVHTIDSLNTLNVQLREEKAEITQELSDQKVKYNKLEGVKEELAGKVKIGARLEANDVMAFAQRVKSNTVHRETTKASKADKIKGCFTLDKNEIANSGKRVLYLRIIAPNGQELAESDENKFAFSGVEGLYSAMKEVDYQNIETDVCMYFEVVEELIPGEYVVEVYSDGDKIGGTKFTLK